MEAILNNRLDGRFTQADSIQIKIIYSHETTRGGTKGDTSTITYTVHYTVVMVAIRYFFRV